MYQTADGGASWQPVTTVAGIKPKGVCGISVASDRVVYAYGRVGGPAGLIKTIDKGLSWTALDLSGTGASSLIDGYFFHPDTGLITGAYGTDGNALIMYTHDGGLNWQTCYKSSRPHEYIWKLSFPSRMVGYASLQGSVSARPDTTYFLKTIDGGRTWQEHIFRTDSFYKLQGIGFINDSTGWMGGDDATPVNYKTTDGGSTWTVDSTFGIQVPPYDRYFNSAGGYSVNRFRRFGDSLMYVSGRTIYRLGNEPQVDVQVVRPVMPSFELYPNPFSDYLIVKMEAVISAEDPLLCVYNIYGQLLLEDVPLRAGLNRFAIRPLAPGIHVFCIRAGGRDIARGRLIAR